jgi:hypothetical protein
MNKSDLMLILAFLLQMSSLVKAQDKPDEYLGLPGDNLNLYAVMDLFQASRSLEDFEASLNDQNRRINNLDLNGDDMVDYLTVTDHVDGSVHTIVLQDALGPNEIQDVAVFTIQRFHDGTAQIQLIGDEALYGKNYIVEPIYDNNNVTLNSSDYDQDGNVSFVITTTNEVAAWPLISFIFSPDYIVWHSLWYWGHYPYYWHSWNPSYWHYYYGYQYNLNHDYYRHYRHWNAPRYAHYDTRYYHGTRSHSPQFSNRVREGRFSQTYSHPEMQHEGENLYFRNHPDKHHSPNDRNLNRPSEYSGQNHHQGDHPANNSGMFDHTGNRPNADDHSWTGKNPPANNRDHGFGFKPGDNTRPKLNNDSHFNVNKNKESFENNRGNHQVSPVSKRGDFSPPQNDHIQTNGRDFSNYKGKDQGFSQPPSGKPGDINHPNTADQSRGRIPFDNNHTNPGYIQPPIRNADDLKRPVKNGNDIIRNRVIPNSRPVNNGFSQPPFNNSGNQNHPTVNDKSLNRNGPTPVVRPDHHNINQPPVNNAGNQKPSNSNFIPGKREPAVNITSTPVSIPHPNSNSGIHNPAATPNNFNRNSLPQPNTHSGPPASNSNVTVKSNTVPQRTQNIHKTNNVESSTPKAAQVHNKTTAPKTDLSPNRNAHRK